MPIFLYWCLPLVLLFDLSVILKLTNQTILVTFGLAYLGMLVALVRSVIIDKNTTRNKNRYRRSPYY
jgi:hypothetical protein